MSSNRLIYDTALKLFLLIFLLPYHLLASANDDRVIIGTYFVPGYVENKTSGKYIKQFKEIVGLLDLDVQLELQPTRRIQHNFLSRNITGYFPELVEFMPDEACRTEAIDQKIVHIFTRKDRRLVSYWQQLDDLQIGAVSGYSYGNELYARPHLKITY
ncbi:hypothetical protein, partial [Candidatus Pelagadaptatus aseana]|uniref:hypothetical protein n=1 Tax=Candidatus Pelagadaptatus aseana TaxID=3120508 RepID=UPI003C6FEF20